MTIRPRGFSMERIFANSSPIASFSKIKSMPSGASFWICSMYLEFDKAAVTPFAIISWCFESDAVPKIIVFGIFLANCVAAQPTPPVN